MQARAIAEDLLGDPTSASCVRTCCCSWPSWRSSTGLSHCSRKRCRNDVATGAAGEHSVQACVGGPPRGVRRRVRACPTLARARRGGADDPPRACARNDGVPRFGSRRSAGLELRGPRARDRDRERQPAAGAAGPPRTSRFLGARGDAAVDRALLESVYEEYSERDELMAAEALSGGVARASAQRWELAADYAERAYDLTTQYGLEGWPPTDRHRRGLRGPRARARTLRAVAAARRGAVGQHTPVHLGTLGFVAMQGGDPQVALRWFAEADAVTTVGGAAQSVAGGSATRPRRCSRSAGWTMRCESSTPGRASEAVGDERTAAHVTRCRGLVAAARGDAVEAASLLEAAVSQHDRARSTLSAGAARCSHSASFAGVRKKRSAREAIEAALADFERLGAATWIEKARAELGRIGGRTRERGLTAAERRVAALVAEGRTNEKSPPRSFSASARSRRI